jgi:hypothetical protein
MLNIASPVITSFLRKVIIVQRRREGFVLIDTFIMINASILVICIMILAIGGSFRARLSRLIVSH